MTTGIDVVALAVAGTMGGSVLLGIWVVAPRLRRRRGRILAERRGRAARAKGNLEDLVGPAPASTPEVCVMAPEPVDACDGGPGDEPVATGWDPRRRESTPMVHLGSRLVHRRCADARRDARPGEICERCAPALAGVGR